MALKDLLARLAWTVLAAAGGNLIGAALFDVTAWKAAALAGLGAGINFVTLYARKRVAENGDA